MYRPLLADGLRSHVCDFGPIVGPLAIPKPAGGGLEPCVALWALCLVRMEAERHHALGIDHPLLERLAAAVAAFPLHIEALAGHVPPEE